MYAKTLSVLLLALGSMVAVTGCAGTQEQNTGPAFAVITLTVDS